MSFLLAFLVGGLLCAAFQFLAMITKIAYSKILIFSICLGAVLTPFGVMAFLEGLGGAGVIATFMDAGSAFTGTLILAFTANQWVPFLTIFCVVVLQIPLGIATGALYEKLHPEEFSKDSTPS